MADVAIGTVLVQNFSEQIPVTIILAGSKQPDSGSCRGKNSLEISNN